MGTDPFRGRLAQLVERLVYTEDVGSSSLSSPTIKPAGKRGFWHIRGTGSRRASALCIRRVSREATIRQPVYPAPGPRPPVWRSRINSSEAPGKLDGALMSRVTLARSEIVVSGLERPCSPRPSGREKRDSGADIVGIVRVAKSRGCKGRRARDYERCSLRKLRVGEFMQPARARNSGTNDPPAWLK